MPELGELAFEPPTQWFVYRGTGRHKFHFVYCGTHRDGNEAIDAAIEEAKATGSPVAEMYMAAPTPAIYTRSTRA